MGSCWVLAGSCKHPRLRWAVPALALPSDGLGSRSAVGEDRSWQESNIKGARVPEDMSSSRNARGQVRKISWRIAPASSEACISVCSIGAQSSHSLQVQAIHDSLAVLSCCLPWLGNGEMLFQRMLVLKNCLGYARIQMHCLLRLVAWTLCSGFAAVAKRLAH